MRYLVVNADDFGHSAEVNEGIVEAHERGIVTSASLMVRRPGARDAARYGGSLSVGLHVELGEWRVIAGRWITAGRVAAADVEAEVRAQLERFGELTGRAPTHLDSHQHVHRSEPARSVVAAIGAELGVPVRGSANGVRYVGGFYGQSDDGTPWPEGISVANLVRLIDGLGEGYTEIGCHPACGVPRGTSYAPERDVERRVLCDVAVRAALDSTGVHLVSFADVP